MAACRSCERESEHGSRRKVDTAVARCDVCSEPVCRHHRRREDGQVMCKRDAKEARRGAVRAVVGLT